MDKVNVFRKPKKYHEKFLDAALEAIQEKYPEEINRYLVHFRQAEDNDLGLLVDYYSMDGKMYGRLCGVIDIPHIDHSQQEPEGMIDQQIRNAFELKIPDRVLKETDRDGMYGRVTDEMTGLDIHLYEGKVHDLSAVVIEDEVDVTKDFSIDLVDRFRDIFPNERDPARIDRILKLIEKLWEQDVDQRFFQLIYNLQYQYSEQHKGKGKIKDSDDPGMIGFDLFTVEDDVLIHFLENKLKESRLLQ
ncbi:hypothetical protein [Spirochaeta africana]|uniref:Uncharacterized protein n=1 Tax=Spirochaeta africana (strain ATCC 700263 / DSM 8902 / Z-7692) TaxID=889378 RepID=H9UIT7_SPIAZ|nr:hypothetical protein [Spirochaeta africana]AFG37430.1 hypothetical protein Spiaf_1364 [Spirochaeta africana DSM 8902]